MSVSSAGAGANKVIRYSVIIDTAQLESKLRTLGVNLKTAFESGNISVTKLGTGIQTVGNQMSTTSVKANTFTGALKTFNTTTVASNTGMNTFTGALRTFDTTVQSSTTKLTSFTGALKTFDASSKTTTTSVEGTASSVSILSKDFNKLATGGLDKTNTLTRTTGESFDKLEKQTGKTTGALGKLKEGFAGNRGLIYSMGTIFGTITGVVAELQLMEDANNQVAEATAKLTQLEKNGQKGTQEYTQAMQQKEKAERFASFTTRNLALAVSNFVPELLLLSTNLAKGGGIASKLGGIFGKLKGDTNILSGALSGAGAAGATGASGLKSFGAALAIVGTRLATISAPITAVVATITGIALAFQKAQADIKLASGDIQTKLEGLQEFFNGWKDIPVIGPLLKAIIEPLGILPKISVQAGKGMGDLSNGIKATDEAARNYIPTVIHLRTSTQGLYENGQYVEKSYTSGAKALDYYGLSLQQGDKYTMKLYDSFKNLTQSFYSGTVAIEKSTDASKENTLVINDQSETLGKAAQAQYDYDQQITTSMQGWTKYQEILVTVDQELNNSFGIFAKGGDALIKYGDTVNKTGFEYIDLGNAAKLDAMSEENRNATIEAAIQINEEYNQSLQEGLDMMKDRNAEIRDLTNTEKILNTVGITKEQIMSTDVETTNKLRDAILDTNFAYKDEEIRLAEILLQHKKLTPELAAMALSTEDNTAALAAAAVGLDDLSTKTDEATKADKDFTKAQEDAAKKVEAFHKAIADANKELESNALNLADALKVKLPDSDKFLKKLLKAFPKSIRKDMEVKIDLIAKKQELEKDFKDIISVALEANEKGEFVFDPNIVADDKSADKFAQGLIKDITTTFGKTPPTKFAVLQQKIQTAIASPKTSDELVKIFTEAGFLTKIEGAGTTMGEKIGTAASKGFTDTWDPAIGFEGGGLDFGENEDKDKKQSAIVIPQSKVPAPDMSEFAQALNDMTKAAQDTATKISSLKYIFPPPNLAKFAGNINSALTGSKTITSKISSIKYDFPPPNLAKFAKNINSALSSAKTITSKIQSIKYDFPPPNLSKFAKNINSALKAAKHIADEISALKPQIHVTYKVDKKPSGLSSGSHMTSANLANLNSNSNANAYSSGMMNVTIVNEDEFGQKKLKRFKAQLGRESYRFG